MEILWLSFVYLFLTLAPYSKTSVGTVVTHNWAHYSSTRN